MEDELKQVRAALALAKTRIDFLKEDISRLQQANKLMEANDARYRYVRQFLDVEDIEVMSGDLWRGHQPVECESVKTDVAIDVALASSPSRPVNEGVDHDR